MYVYGTLPIRTQNSPGAPGRLGVAFLLLLLDNFPMLHGEPIKNSIYNFFVRKVYPLHALY